MRGEGEEGEGEEEEEEEEQCISSCRWVGILKCKFLPHAGGDDAVRPCAHLLDWMYVKYWEQDKSVST